MIYIFLAFFGLAIGSFLGVLADRLSRGTSIGGRSLCDFCHKKLAPQDLVPVFSFLVSHGKSQCCGKKLSWHYPAIEISTAAAYLFLWPSTDITLYVLVSAAIVIIFADIRYRVIPDAMVILLVLIAILRGSNIPHLLAGLVLAGALGLIHLLTKGRGMGLGDVKLVFPIGLLLGPLAGFLALYLAFLTGGLYGATLLMTGKKRLKSMIPFGPFLVIGMLVMLLYGGPVIRWVDQYIW